MFIALVGTPSAGKHSVLDYLVEQHGFTELNVVPETLNDASSSASKLVNGVDKLSVAAPSSTPRTTFASPDDLLEYATRHWREHFVTTSLSHFDDIDPFLKRPFFLLVAVDGPLGSRFLREQRRANGALTLEDFVSQHDSLLHGAVPKANSSITSLTPEGASNATDLSRVLSAARITVNNHFDTLAELNAHLDGLDLLDEGRLRPGWDLYFMTLASLAAHRSNCMKRRVGAVLVRSKRILSTGYNGTARGMTNCNEGGCSRCNGPAKGGEALANCLCLHAEENALLEAGKERIGMDAVLYCNTCPCLLCSVKIVQCGVREVVYNQSYSMDTASAAVLKEGGVILRKMDMPPA